MVEMKCSVITTLVIVILFILLMYRPQESINNFRPQESINNFIMKPFSRKSYEYLVVETTNKNLPSGPPVITNAGGGMGNQLFEFACAYSIAKKRNSNTYVLAPPEGVYNYKNREHFPTMHTFALDHFKINFSEVSVKEDFSTYGSGEIFDFTEQHIWEKSLPANQVLRVSDVCVSEVYFKEYRQEIKDMFVLDIDENPVKEILRKVENSQSVSVHVRRGDYTRKSDNRTIPITFQKRAMKWMERMVHNATFFVFSDDLDYAKKKFKRYINIIFVDNSKEKLSSLYDFLIMSRCKHNIIANSTFSWWAAYLNANKNKIVIGPMPRHPPGWNERMYTNKDFYKYRELVLDYYLYPNDWLTLNPFEY